MLRTTGWGLAKGDTLSNRYVDASTTRPRRRRGGDYLYIASGDARLKDLDHTPPADALSGGLFGLGAQPWPALLVALAAVLLPAPSRLEAEETR